MRGLPFGVEEEYLLLDARDGTPLSHAARVLAQAEGACARSSGAPAAGRCHLQPELVRAQLEIATPICRDLAQAREAMTAGRGLLAGLAADVGAVLAPVGAAPVEGPVPVPVTEVDRYRAIFAGAPALVREQVLNGMHVHVQVPARDTGVTVMNRMRPWLHVLLALAANSPLWRGRDSGFASMRAVNLQRWAVEGVPPSFKDGAEYERRVDGLLATGVVIDRAQLYWSIRLSERYPTVEVRVTDVQLDVDSAVMVAALVRALVLVSMQRAAAGEPEPPVPVELLRAAGWQAARDGVTDHLVDLLPAGGRGGSGHSAVLRPAVLRPAADVVGSLLDHVAPVAAVAGVDEVAPLVAAVLLGEGGAQRQRRAVARGGLPALLDLFRMHTHPQGGLDAGVGGSARHEGRPAR